MELTVRVCSKIWTSTTANLRVNYASNCGKRAWNLSCKKFVFLPDRWWFWLPSNQHHLKDTFITRVLTSSTRTLWKLPAKAELYMCNPLTLRKMALLADDSCNIGTEKNPLPPSPSVIYRTTKKSTLHKARMTY